MKNYPGLRFYWLTIHEIATAHQLDPFLVAALCCALSQCNADAFHHERQFWNRYMKRQPRWRTANPRRVSSRYGLLLVSYPLAVEEGFAGAPEDLFQPATGLEAGCRMLGKLQARLLAERPLAPLEALQTALAASYHGGFQLPDQLRPHDRAFAQEVARILQHIRQSEL